MKSINKAELHSLFEGVANKEEEKFNILYKKYHTLVYGIAFSMAKNKENSEDIVQTVFHKIWTMPKQNLPTNGEASWLYTLTKNETINFLKKEKPTLDVEELCYIADENDEIDEIIEKVHYNKIISKLNKKEQEIISLKILSQLSFRQIAQILNMPIATVQWKYYKSLHTLELLLSNLSIFVIAIGLFIFSRNVLHKNTSNQEESTQENTTNTEETSNTDSEEKKKEESKIPETSEDSVSTNIENQLEENIQNSIITETTEEVLVEENNNFSSMEVGMLSIAGIFLIFSIIFSIIFIKHQQKQKEKMSK